MAEDWFRNHEWNPTIAEQFEGKLRRARRKEQYLRIQADYLARSHPEIALALLDRFFEMEDQFERASAYVARATALLQLGRVRDAVDSYRQALDREREFPKLLTSACFALPLTVATHEIRDCYDLALEVLNGHRHRCTFPIDSFKWHAARALILAARGAVNEAASDAAAALKAAGLKNSGFRYHPDVGLVGDADAELVRRLSSLTNGRS